MSSVSISQILQITSAKADAKSQPSSAPQGDEFERVLARVSGASEQRTPVAASTVEAPEAEPALADDSGEDAATTPDDQSAVADIAVTAVAEGEEPAPTEELLLDEIELSEAAVVAMITQAPVAVEYPVRAVDTTAEGEFVAVADAVAPDAPAKPQAAVLDFSQAFDAAPSTTEIVSGEPVVVDATAKFNPEQAAPEQSKLEITPTETLATELPAPETSARLLTTETVEVAPIQAATEVAPKTPAKAPKVATQQTKQTVVLETGGATDPTDKTDAVERPTRPEPIAVAAPLKPELVAAGEVKVISEEKPAPEVRAVDSSPVRHENQDNRPQATNTADTSRADANILADTDPVSTADRVRFVQRVSRAFQTAQSRDGVIQLRLSPPELGAMKIAISTQQGILTAKVETETAAARNVILDNLPALRERLAEQQIRLERFDVDVRRDGSQSPGNWEAADRQSRDSNTNSNSNRVRQAPVAAPRVARAVGSDSSLDVRI